MYRSQRHQQGAVMMIMLVIVIMGVLTALVGMTGEWVAGTGRQFSTTNDTLNQIQKALISFTATYQRLPCPADPSGVNHSGWPNGSIDLTLPVGSCSYPTGVVPWNALGLTQGQVIDKWGRLISYRVYDDSVSTTQSYGTVGLTQNSGASALPCANNYLPASTVLPTSNGLCDPANIPLQRTLHSSSFPNFITSPLSTPPYDKGLWVYDFGTTVKNVAFVLISHGSSGLGGYLPNGNQMPMPVSGAFDYPNTQTRIPPLFFTKQAASNTEIAFGTNGHYDDVVNYLTISELLKLTNQDARAWQ